MKKKRKVVRIFSRLNTGGPSLHVINLTKGLTALGFETHLVVGVPAPWEGSMEAYAQEQGVSLHKIFSLKPKPSLFSDFIAFFLF